MPAIFTGRWSRAQILNQALQRVGNKKIIQLAREQLNRLLEELYTQWEWPFLYTEYPFTMPGGNTGGPSRFATFALPANFLKTESETTGLLIDTKDGLVWNRPILERDPVVFRRYAIPSDQEAESASIWFVDYATRFGAVWPRPVSALGCTLHYKFIEPDKPEGRGGLLGQSSDQTTIDYDADIPLFPWGGFLAMAMEAWALDYERDPRALDKRQEVWGDDGAFHSIRAVAMPRNSQESVVPLDPAVFGRPFRDESARRSRDTDWW